MCRHAPLSTLIEAKNKGHLPHPFYTIFFLTIEQFVSRVSRLGPGQIYAGGGGFAIYIYIKEKIDNDSKRIDFLKNITMLI
jgi:hypothetical protein